MDIVSFSLSSLPKKENLSISLGTFDGFHEGHAFLARTARYESSYLNAILLFSISPTCVLSKLDAPYLTSLEQKIRQAKINRYEAAYIIEANEEFFSLTHEQFEKLLFDIGVKEIFVGEDYRYGKDATGNTDTLIEAGFKVHVIPLLIKEGIKISSSNIRRYLLDGDIEKANSNLGYPYEIEGKVIEGNKIGRTIGFPTLNLLPSFNNIVPKEGVYAGLVYVRGRPYKAMISVGHNPTVKGKSLSIEGHLLDFDEEIYGRQVSFAFLKRVRDIIEFKDLNGLKAQLEKDKETLLDLLNE